MKWITFTQIRLNYLEWVQCLKYSKVREREREEEDIDIFLIER